MEYLWRIGREANRSGLLNHSRGNSARRFESCILRLWKVAQVAAIGLENRATVTRKGSTPLLSAYGGCRPMVRTSGCEPGNGSSNLLNYP
jgi:hypothetical protein